MPPVRERKHAFIEFEADIDMYSVGCLLVCSGVDIFCVGKANQMPIEAKMHFDHGSVIEHEKEILAFASNRLDAAPREQFRHMRRRLGQNGDWVKYLDTANFAPRHVRPQCDRNRFDFGKFWHWLVSLL